MGRVGLVLSASVFLGLSAIGRADPDRSDLLKQAQALQTLVQRVIAEAEPSVACVLVSRSDAYRRFGLGPAAEYPGRLGGVDAALLERHLRKLGLSREDRESLLRQLDLSDRQNVPEAFGSGVVIDAGGLILTHYHVVRDATRIFVRLPGGKSSYADIYAADPRSDLAVLRLLDGNLRLQPLPLGDGGKVERGQFVVALTNPHAVGFQDGQPSCSWGIISNIRRRAPDRLREDERSKTLHHYGTLLQTDVRLNLGCSGGALVNLKGELIGLTTSMAALQGSDIPGGFAVPLDSAITPIVEILKRGEEVEYGFLGVGFERGEDTGPGVTLAHVTTGSPADRAGLKPRDVLLSLNGQPLHHREDVFRALSVLLTGARVTVEVRRANGVRERVECVLAKYHVPGKVIAANSRRPFYRGLRVDHSSILVQMQPRPANVSGIPTGVLITDVLPDSPAATAVLKVGEVITHVNNRLVETPADFYQQVRGVTGAVELTLLPPPGQLPIRVTLN